MALKAPPAITELRNAGKRLFVEFFHFDELMVSLKVAPGETMAQVTMDPETWGVIRPCLTERLRKQNYLRFKNACLAYIADTQHPAH